MEPERMEYRAALTTDRGGNILTEHDLCLWCRGEKNRSTAALPGYEFCRLQCEQAFWAQRRAERKVRP